MAFDIVFMLFVILVMLFAIFVLVAAYPGPKKSRRG